MKNKTGIVIGFIFGVSIFLLLFKVIILDHVAPADELAPGMVVMTSLISGVLFAYMASKIQFRKRR